MSSKLLGWVVLLYFTGGLTYLVAAVFQQAPLNRFARGVTYLGWALHTVSFLWRWVESYYLDIGHAPLANFYESLLFFSWAVICVSHGFFGRQMRDYVGGITATLACLILAYASFGGHSNQIMPLMPALKSNWLIIHVVTCFLAYAAFALGFGVAILFFFQRRASKGSVHTKGYGINLPELDELIYRAIIIGFFMLTLGILTGAVWAESAWGRYWSWDPKETWSLITWFIYAGFLHARLVRGWQGRRVAVLAVVGFLAVLFTYFGVSFLLPGLHAYLT
ncbi:c-type cytochrome biogenesis protein CcsB [Desulfobacca acetoxidans]|uniref:Heme exporter protein C n=1 Tax=Desulfobacca acetoxidans (strain ATCC 700848 / DSM 11109 / ASRB2) TaxID=880072 RepID=F2NIH4_DESAR|nr:c-type cytochrome biogenesis protein CcsB [Desulfobacca acetoxidans]AEB10376.1 cytochrome c-type biogenesis protein CcsB [Desulfobacca acetoxidans DSM 11109]